MGLQWCASDLTTSENGNSTMSENRTEPERKYYNQTSARPLQNGGIFLLHKQSFFIHRHLFHYFFKVFKLQSSGKKERKKKLRIEV